MPHFEGDIEKGPMEQASSPQSSSSVVHELEPAVAAESSAITAQRLSHLNEMFDNDDGQFGLDDFTEDEIQAATAIAETAQSVNIPPPRAIQSSGQQTTPELMEIFYQRLFPFKDLFQWLNHFPSPTPSFTNREIAFTLQNDVYLRYQSFPTYDAMRKEVIRLNPSRFEIGPVYSANPRDRKIVRKTAFRPLEKELVFDIDMTDYDEIRTCCSGAKICNKCWNFITVAIKVLDVALREDFGFKHILWVYSGRRGAHAWVCDKRARGMDDTKRRAVASYLELVRGGAQTTKKVNLKRPLHPSITRSLNILRDSFSSAILVDQDPWKGPEDAEKLLKLLPDKMLNQELKKTWEALPDQSSTSKWACIDRLAQQGVSKSLDARELMEAKQDVVLEYLYPRLDAEVSKHLNHLLKSPFCIHPGTGRVCVPINSARPETFDPMDVPTVTQLIDEIDEYDATHKANESSETLADYEKTSLKPYVDYFHRFVSDLMKEEMKEKRQRSQENQESLDF
ncbi:hypothetical protein V1525DRAFT_399004 [Lipomyces kononenkoae]|uniref:Uncharacterized protein n=1 Tax=Lipomyces kononenkoae TaxID=34357 RepID=A0ACC3T6E1_LIPKO